MNDFSMTSQTMLNFNCWGFKINDKEEIVFEKRGTDSVFHSDFLMPIGEKLTIILVAENSKAKEGFNSISLIINGELVMKRKESFDLSCNGQGFNGIEIGVIGETLIEFFSGKLSMFKVYNNLLTPPQLARLTKVTKKLLADGIPADDEDDKYSPEMTVDRRFCIS
jgi:hypothetical protein